MSEVKSKALAKMLEEMDEDHTPQEDAIHNWLCEQDEDALFEGILKEDKSIAGSLKACAEKAKKQAKNGVAMINDETVFGWVYQYFTSSKLSKAKASAKKTKTKKIKAPTEGIEQISLFDSL